MASYRDARESSYEPDEDQIDEAEEKLLAKNVMELSTNESFQRILIENREQHERIQALTKKVDFLQSQANSQGAWTLGSLINLQLGKKGYQLHHDPVTLWRQFEASKLNIDEFGKTYLQAEKVTFSDKMDSIDIEADPRQQLKELLGLELNTPEEWRPVAERLEHFKKNPFPKMNGKDFDYITTKLQSIQRKEERMKIENTPIPPEVKNILDIMVKHELEKHQHRTPTNERNHNRHTNQPYQRNGFETRSRSRSVPRRQY